MSPCRAWRLSSTVKLWRLFQLWMVESRPTFLERFSWKTVPGLLSVFVAKRIDWFQMTRNSTLILVRSTVIEMASLSTFGRMPSTLLRKSTDSWSGCILTLLGKESRYIGDQTSKTILRNRKSWTCFEKDRQFIKRFPARRRDRSSPHDPAWHFHGQSSYLTSQPVAKRSRGIESSVPLKKPESLHAS